MERRLKEDIKIILSASGQAQKATDYILNIEAEREENNDDAM